MDAKKTAQQVLEQVGGAENVTFLTHCVTRLRFNLKSMDGVDEAKVKAVPGVVGVVNKGGQYQVIIGNEVAAVYDELILAAFVHDTHHAGYGFDLGLVHAVH